MEDAATKAGCCYVKGSPEAISSLCVASSIPSNFSSVLSGYTHQGYRVIAFAYKSLSEPLPHVDKSEQRLLVEKELTFMGLLLLEKRSQSGDQRDADHPPSSEDPHADGHRR